MLTSLCLLYILLKNAFWQYLGIEGQEEWLIEAIGEGEVERRPGCPRDQAIDDFGQGGRYPKVQLKENRCPEASREGDIMQTRKFGKRSS
jgi:hypothetical protein